WSHRRKFLAKNAEKSWPIRGQSQMSQCCKPRCGAFRAKILPPRTGYEPATAGLTSGHAARHQKGTRASKVITNRARQSATAQCQAGALARDDKNSEAHGKDESGDGSPQARLRKIIEVWRLAHRHSLGGRFVLRAGRVRGQVSVD